MLLALVKACRSPVKCRLMSSIGTTWLYPPPVAPPLIPKTGPMDGSRIAMMVWWLSLLSASPNPTNTVDFPSPAGVGLIDVTNTSLCFLLSFFFNGRFSFALYLPYCSISSSDKPIFSAILAIGSIVAWSAISISVSISRFLLILLAKQELYLQIN